MTSTRVYGSFMKKENMTQNKNRQKIINKDYFQRTNFLMFIALVKWEIKLRVRSIDLIPE